MSRLANLADRMLSLVAPKISAEACGYQYTGRQVAGPCNAGYCLIYCTRSGKTCTGAFTSNCECLCP